MNRILHRVVIEQRPTVLCGRSSEVDEEVLARHRRVSTRRPVDPNRSDRPDDQLRRARNVELLIGLLLVCVSVPREVDDANKLGVVLIFSTEDAPDVVFSLSRADVENRIGTNSVLILLHASDHVLEKVITGTRFVAIEVGHDDVSAVHLYVRGIPRNTKSGIVVGCVDAGLRCKPQLTSLFVEAPPYIKFIVGKGFAIIIKISQRNRWPVLVSSRR